MEIRFVYKAGPVKDVRIEGVGHIFRMTRNRDGKLELFKSLCGKTVYDIGRGKPVILKDRAKEADICLECAHEWKYMDRLSLYDTFLAWIGGIGWSIFLWSIGMTSEQYMEIVGLELKQMAELAKLRAELETLKRTLLQAQNAAIELAEKLLRLERDNAALRRIEKAAEGMAKALDEAQEWAAAYPLEGVSSHSDYGASAVVYRNTRESLAEYEAAKKGAE